MAPFWYLQLIICTNIFLNKCPDQFASIWEEQFVAGIGMNTIGQEYQRFMGLTIDNNQSTGITGVENIRMPIKMTKNPSKRSIPHVTGCLIDKKLIYPISWEKIWVLNIPQHPLGKVNQVIQRCK